MRVYGLVEFRLAEAIELFLTREEADEALGVLLRDEPSWKDMFGIEEIDLGHLSQS